MGLHDDHRKRLREQYAKNGMGSLTEERLLELILFTPIPRKDTYDISKRLLKRFGNIRGVLEANIEDLQEIEDVGFSTALYLKAIYDAAYNYILPHAASAPSKFHNEQELKKFILDMFDDSVVEKIAVICLSRDYKLLYHGILQEGDVSSAAFHMRRLTEVAIKTNAAYVYIAHNHPHGTEMPSNEDLDATRRMASSLATNGIELCEHYVIHGKGMTSIMRVMGYNTQCNDLW